MKLKNILLTIGLALVASVIQAAPTLSAWCSSGTFTGSGGGSYTFGTTNFCIGSINSGSGQTAACNYVQATSDLAGSVLTIWQDTNPDKGLAPGYGAYSNSTTTIAMFNVNTNAFAITNITVGQPVVIRHIANDNYEVRSVASVDTTTGFVVVNAAPTTAVAYGDMVYPMVAAAKIVVGAATASLGPAGGVFTQEQNAPAMVSINFTSAGTVNAFTGKFIAP